ncbi:MAG: hypothetical protein E7Z92_04090 [Cyanobacteria bacterium SIG31]|nr:hypothetical protein [Cyanobacteria bacterium SIG31]
MAVLPGSLDYLYHNGIINHIPYEAYYMPPMAGAYGQYPQYMNGVQYLNAAKQGSLYDTYAVDSYTRFNPYYGENNGKSFRENILDSAKNAKDKISNTPTIIKGLVGAAIVAGTLACLFKGKKPPAAVTGTPAATTSSFWSKINPLNWFKK